MKKLIAPTLLLSCVAFAFVPQVLPAQATNSTAEIRTPKPPATPRINGPGIFGVRPGHPFLYHIPATGDRPMEFSVKGVPDGLEVDAKTGDIRGTIKKTRRVCRNFSGKERQRFHPETL